MSRRVVGAAVCFGLFGCGSDAETVEPQATDRAAPSQPKAAVPSVSRKVSSDPERPRRSVHGFPRLLLREGVLKDPSTGALVRERPPRDRWLQVTSARARLASEDGTVMFVFEQDARIRFGSSAALQIYLAEGSAMVSVAPRGGAALPPVRVVFPGASATLPTVGTMFLQTLSGGHRTWLAAVGGGLLLHRVERGGERATLDRIGSRGGPRIVDAAGQLSLAGGPAPQNERAARQTGKEWLANAQTSEVPTPTASVLLSSLEAAIESALELQGETKAILSGPKPETEQARAAIRHAAVRLAQQQSGTREQLLLRWERAVLRTGFELDDSRVSIHRQRVQRLLAP